MENHTQPQASKHSQFNSISTTSEFIDIFCILTAWDCLTHTEKIHFYTHSHILTLTQCQQSRQLHSILLYIKIKKNTKTGSHKTGTLTQWHAARLLFNTLTTSLLYNIMQMFYMTTSYFHNSKQYSRLDFTIQQSCHANHFIAHTHTHLTFNI